MNRAAQELGRLGGRVRSEAKTNANRAKAKRFWDAVRAGAANVPRRGIVFSGKRQDERKS